MFEFDPEKSEANLVKHGISFDKAQLLWQDPNVSEFPSFVSDEPLWLVVGRIGEKHWTAVITKRGSFTRINSVRGSRMQEIDSYEST